MKVKNLYKNEMMKYVSDCEYVLVGELVMVYMACSVGRNIDSNFVKKRVEKFCRKYGKKVSEVEFDGYIVRNVKNVYKF